MLWVLKRTVWNYDPTYWSNSIQLTSSINQSLGNLWVIVIGCIHQPCQISLSTNISQVNKEAQADME